MKKNILIVGGSGGVGFETAKRLSKENVISATYRNEEKKKKVEEIDGVDFYKMDLLDEKSIQRGIEKIINDKQEINSVVYTVSSKIKNQNIFKMEWDDIQAHIDVQLKGIFNIVKSLENQIKEKGGIKFIIVLSEVCFGAPPAGMAHYTAAKYALLGFSKTLALELSKYNCTVNMVSPGMIETDLLSTFPVKLVEIVAEKNPLKRIAKPDDVAKVIEFLLSEDSDYLNGINIPVNGGGVMV